MALRSPRANRSIGASAKTRANSNSAIARANIVKSIAPPSATDGNSWPNSLRYTWLPFRRLRTAWRMGSLRNPVGVWRGHYTALSVVENVEARPDRSCGARESSDLHQLRGWNMSLRDEQVCDDWVVGGELGASFRSREEEAPRVIERISRRRREAPIPHQVGVKRGVDHSGCAPLITRSGTVGPHQIVILDADGDGLSVAHAVRRRVAPPTRVVIMQSARDIEPEQPPKVR